jgi:pimeloyl-ACP methyl ester carboxylesterase
MALKVIEGGTGNDVLLLLHGLGGTGEVWRDVQQHWRGRWAAPDLPGHGESDRLETYTFDAMARELSPLIRPGDRVSILGHSLGGVLALLLGGWHDEVQRVVGLGIKVEWAPDELAKAAAMAEKPSAWFESEADAVSWHRRVSGISDLVDDDIASRGVVDDHGRWRLRLDYKAFAVGAPDMRSILAACRAPVTLARGEHDHMVSDRQLADLVADPVTLSGLGHNAHLEDPAAVYALL